MMKIPAWPLAPGQEPEQRNGRSVVTENMRTSGAPEGSLCVPGATFSRAMLTGASPMLHHEVKTILSERVTALPTCEEANT